MKTFRIRSNQKIRLLSLHFTVSFAVGFIFACFLLIRDSYYYQHQIFCEKESLLDTLTTFVSRISIVSTTESEEISVINSPYLNNISEIPDASYWKRFEDVRKKFHHPSHSVEHPRLLCWMMTDPNIISLARYAQQTWFQKCDIPLLFSSEKDDNFPTIGLKVPAGRISIAAKAHLAWEHIHKYYFNKADFFLKGDPDSFVFVNNLKRFLANRNPSQATYFGHALFMDLSFLSIHRNFKGFYTAGEGVILTKAALSGLIKIINFCPLTNGTSEDVKTSVCLAMAGVSLTDTRDLKGRETFLPPLSLANIANSVVPRWYTENYRRYIGYCNNLTCLSSYPIVTHYVNGDEMFIYEYMSRVIDELSNQINHTDSHNYRFRGLFELKFL